MRQPPWLITAHINHGRHLRLQRSRGPLRHGLKVLVGLLSVSRLKAGSQRKAPRMILEAQ